MKNLLKLGKALNKAEQKNVFGGTEPLRNARNEGSGSGCSYDHRDVCLDGSPCSPGDFCSGHGCGHWVMVC